jgi:hypothetical protein
MAALGGAKSAGAQVLQALPPVDISGMARLTEQSFLLVHDTKADDSRPHLGVLTVTGEDPPAYQPVRVRWPAGQDRANDLESICALPDAPREFLAAESGYQDNRFGRIFHFSLQPRGRGWEARVRGVVPLPRDTDNIEGLAVLPRATDQYILLLGERGGSEARPRGLLRWGVIDLRSYSLTLNGERRFAAPEESSGGAFRDISDLYIDPATRILWISATRDPGDAGPFGSSIWPAGQVQADVNQPVSLYPQPERAWKLDGLKVEALAGPAQPDSRISIGTDDESYGGVWRPLF